MNISNVRMNRSEATLFNSINSEAGKSNGVTLFSQALFSEFTLEFAVIYVIL